jgi:peptidoglycan/LPS O-acetylase OafA/YrhL
MKKAVFLFIIVAVVAGTCFFWFISSGEGLSSTDIFHSSIIALILAFAIFVGYKRLSSAKRGEPTEDELSKKVIQKTAAWSYYISLYMWVAMIYIKDRVSMDTEELLGTGILGMAICFGVCWLIFNFKGIKNE